MLLNQAQHYRAIRSHDPRFDGHFFFAVNSTGIYCRPVCTAKAPKPENCLFFPNATAAEAAGFRPCLRCRPELISGNASINAVTCLVQRALSFIEDGFLDDAYLNELAKELQITGRHLRRIFQAELGVTPIKFSQTQRLLLAKRLLTDTGLPITEVAFAAGFHSLRRFNALFKNHYGLNPTNFRQTITVQKSADSLIFELHYQPPLDWKLLLEFISARSIPMCEEINNGIYRRIVRIYHGNQWHTGWFSVYLLPNLCVLQVTLDIKLIRVILPVIKRIKRLFDLTCHPNAIEEVLGSSFMPNSGLRVPGAFEGFEIAIQTILSQQIPIKTVRAIIEQFVTYFGEPQSTPFPDLTHAFPDPERLASTSVEEISSLGITPACSKEIISLAQAIVDKHLVLSPDADVSRTLEQLRSLLTIDECSVQYIVMRSLSWPDAFPISDKTLMKTLGVSSSIEAQECAKTWQPWRSYAAMHFMV